MDSSKKRLNEKNLDSYLSSLGFQFPITESDLERFQENNSDFVHELDGNEINPEQIFMEVEKEEIQSLPIKKKRKDNIYFKRMVLAGEIASQLHGEPTFGHIKFQKIVYLCEKVLKLNTEKRYSKEAAGPCDNKFMHSVDREFKKQGWFDVKLENRGRYQKYAYKPLDKLDKQREYFDRYFTVDKNNFFWILDTFKKSKTRDVELVATIYACLEEFKNDNEPFSKDKLFEKIYDWSDRKLQFSKKEISNTHQWMMKEKLTPEHLG
ncbi:MAG: hypothetical protein R2764_08485 [Bacteroidales bacterium]